MDLFSLFTTTSYSFLELKTGPGGNRIVKQTPATGIIKHRSGMVQDPRGETKTAQSTIHIRPAEAFIEAIGGHQSLVGHGIRADGVDYRIESATPGTDPDTGLVEFYLCKLKREALWQSASPLV
jgi:hypothetical protein